MAKEKYKCALCDAPLRDLDDHKKRHDRRCRGFKKLHNDAVARISQQLSAQVAPLPLPAPTPIEVDEPVPPPPPEPTHRASGLPNRKRRPPAKLADAAPPPRPRMRGKKAVAPAPAPTPDPDPNPPVGIPEPPQHWVRTPPNAAGLYKVYPRRPTHDPDALIVLRDLYEADAGPNDIPLPQEPWYYPFPNPTVAHLMRYHIEEEHPESIAGFDRLIAVLQNSEAQSDGVVAADIPLPFSTKKFLDELDRKGIEPLGVSDKWMQGTVKLSLPCTGRRQTELAAPTFAVSGIHYRPLLDTMCEVLQGPLFRHFHTTPFSLRFDPTFDWETAETDLPDVLGETMPQELSVYGLPPLAHDHEDVYGEAYTSSAMLDAYSHIPQPPSPQSPDDPVESIVVAFMEWSDATHLAQFGTASLWPGYTFFGNHPKDFRNKPTSNAGFHQAYFSSLPESIRYAYRESYGYEMPDDVFTHLKRDLMHRIWELILSDEFLDAYDNGIKIRCWDGLVRLVFPRFFSYSADYLEKVLLATIKSMGGCPCPRCFIQKKQIAETGTAEHSRLCAKIDLRKRIGGRRQDHRWSIEEELLGPRSRNAFSRLNTAKTPFNFYSMFVPDLLHEVELGVAKAVIIHLIRMLITFKKTDLFDQRFQEIDPFGASTIRRFRRVSDLKHAAARDYEDILQCILPVLEGLFPSHQALVNTLCFELAVWHGLAKLRMHTTSTIRDFRTWTTQLMSTIRRFARETRDVKTYEFTREENRRNKKAARAAAAAAQTGASDVSRSQAIPSRGHEVPVVQPGPLPAQQSNQTVVSPASSGSQLHPTAAASLVNDSGAAASASVVVRTTKLEKPFNPITYKLHSLPDYPDAVVHSGTSDSFSTQTGELAHCLCKYFYRRTNKRNYMHQIAQHEHRRRLMRAMWERRKLIQQSQSRALRTAGGADPVTRDGDGKASTVSTKQRRLTAALHPKSARGYRPYIPPEQHHFISHSNKTHCHLSDFPDDRSSLPADAGSDGRLTSEPLVEDVAWDPAFVGFPRKLLSHFRRRLLDLDDDRDDLLFTDSDLAQVIVEKGLLFTHATMYLNYTTYDLRRDRDSFNLRNRRFFIVHSQDSKDPHRFWYGEIAGIFHANVLLADVPGTNFRRLEFVWVRWMQRDISYRCGFDSKRLPRICYIQHNDPDAFGFLDPADIVRAAHLIPAFHHGRTTEYLPKSVAHRPSHSDEDWKYYYANMVVDRDMLMRYRDNVVGHRRFVPRPAQLDGKENSTLANDDPSQSNSRDGGAQSADGAELAAEESRDVVQAEDKSEDEDGDWCEEAGGSASENEEEDGEDNDGLLDDPAVHSRLGFEAS
uniref:C2H2-type domain-containing protein n=1 Tax=Mycena chlorophos TaxID=658473 RepID=A0ABQ0KXF0_MYCCL|nr:predicted protein [Mycena chlorophos]